MDATGLGIEQVHGNVLSSWTLTNGGTRLVVRWEREVTGSVPSDERWRCHVGDEGAYTVRLAEDGARLILGLVSDPCAPRAAFLLGSWTRCGTDCGDEVAALAPIAPGSSGDRSLPDLSLPSASDLRGHWTHVEDGGPSPAPTHVDVVQGSATELLFEPVSFVVGGTEPRFTGPWFIHEAGMLSVGLWSSPPNWFCEIGAQGVYYVHLRGDVLSISIQSDQCITRAASLEGDWTRNPEGQLGSARRTLPEFRPFGPGTTGSLSTTNSAAADGRRDRRGRALREPVLNVKGGAGDRG